MRRSIFILSLVLFGMACSEKNELWEADRQFEAGNYETAIEMYTTHLALNPTDVKALFNRGRSFEELKQNDRAIEDFLAVIEERPTHIEANIAVGRDYYFRKKDYAMCIKFVNDALLAEKKSPKAYTLRGKAFQKLGELFKANNDYNNAISVDDEYPEAYYSRASLKIIQNKVKEACADFQIAKSLGLEEADVAISKYCK